MGRPMDTGWWVREGLKRLIFFFFKLNWINLGLGSIQEGLYSLRKDFILPEAERSSKAINCHWTVK